jgi:hypothetical protein
LDHKSSEYAFICILFLVDSIVPHNIRKCCKANGVGGVGGIYVISDAVGVGAGDIISGGANTSFLCVLVYQKVGSKTLSF